MKFEKKIISADFKDLIGQEDVKSQMKSALISGRHIVLVGQPGIGKTTLAKSVASLFPGKEFVRVQGSPDLTAEDLIGDIDPVKAMKHGPSSKEAFSPGKIFKADNGILFFDEINRCSEKLQNALLQALGEKKVTIGSYSLDFDADFIFIGTMNPDDTSTEPLSDVFKDRFDMIYMSYPESLELEVEIVKAKGNKIADFSDELLAKILTFIRVLRSDENVEKKPSVRASIGLYERAQANAVVEGRSKVIPEDISNALLSVLAHRIRLKPSVKYLKKAEDYLKNKYEEFLEDIGQDGDYL